MKNDIVGTTIGNLECLRQEGFYQNPNPAKGKTSLYVFLCVCGKEFTSPKYPILAGTRVSCGCMRKNRKHGRWGEEEYNVWNLMVQRTTNPNNDSYKAYGAKGRGIDESWADEYTGFSTFIEDMGKRPTPKHTIERVDVNLGYSKENCIWTDDRSLQAYNTGMFITNTSGRTGVMYQPNDFSPWRASICKNGKVHSKRCATFEEAVEWRRAKELELFGFTKDNQK